MQRKISIRPVLNGWVVGAGCQRLAYDDKQKLLLDLAEWLEAPDKTEARIIAGARNREHLMPRPERPVGIRTGGIMQHLCGGSRAGKTEAGIAASMNRGEVDSALNELFQATTAAPPAGGEQEAPAPGIDREGVA